MSSSAPVAFAPVRVSIGERLTAAFLATLALTVLIVAWRLTPDPSGAGTHQQLGLPACGWLVASGYPCPTCGMTTAFAAAAHGDPWRAIVSQPLGALLAVGTAVFFWASLHVAVFGSQLGRAAGRLLSGKILWTALVVFLLAWGYKIVQVRGGV